ncbi:MAG: hypothetical protein NXI31_13800 [bacterium]|nr:hypothetical protein [bacterium]
MADGPELAKESDDHSKRGCARQCAIWAAVALACFVGFSVTCCASLYRGRKLSLAELRDLVRDNRDLLREAVKDRSPETLERVRGAIDAVSVSELHYSNGLSVLRFLIYHARLPPTGYAIEIEWAPPEQSSYWEQERPEFYLGDGWRYVGDFYGD